MSEIPVAGAPSANLDFPEFSVVSRWKNDGNVVLLSIDQPKNSRENTETSIVPRRAFNPG